MKGNSVWLGTDGYHGLNYVNTTGGGTIDGPTLYGYSGGCLQTTGVASTPLRWNAYGVGIWNSAPASGTPPLQVGTTPYTVAVSYGYVNSAGGTGTSGNTGTQNFSAYFNGRIGVTGEVDIISDVRAKKNIETLSLDLCMEFLRKTRPVTFEWRKEDSGIHYGYIAQILFCPGKNGR
jgi:hypothetical protein